MDLLKDILDNLNDSIIIIDSHGKIVLCNQEAQRIQKTISEKPIEIGALLTELVSDERKQTVTEILKTLKRQKKPVKNFAEYHTPFGGSIFLEVNFVPVFGTRKELKYVNVIAQDITSRKLSERKVKTVTADVNKLIENAHAVIFSIDSRGYIVEWNSHCAELTGFNKKEILAKKLSDVLARGRNIDRKSVV